MRVENGKEGILVMMQKVCYALGFFDGVHRGHRAILDAARANAANNAMVSGAFTYKNHPKSITAKAAPPMLTTQQERCELFLSCGIERIVMLEFTAEFAQVEPEEFIAILEEKYDCGGVCCGENFHFGAKGRGDAELLQYICAKKNILCQVVKPVKIGDAQISSTEIRKMVEKGKMQEAQKALCRPFSLEGKIIHGDGRGAKNGVPTINFDIKAEDICPKVGVYATFVRIADNVYSAVTNAGTRPTFYENGKRGIETHLLDYNGDIYDKTARVYFMDFLREERAFGNKEDLYRQISLDIEHAQMALSTADRRGIDELS